MNLQNTENRLVGIYEKGINNKWSLEDKIKIAKAAGFDFMEFSVDETDERLARLDWSDAQIKEVQKLLIKHEFNFNSMTLSGHRKYPFGSKDAKIRQKAYEIMEKAIILAKKLGIRTVQLAGYDVYYEPSDQETIDNFIVGIKWATRLAQKHSVMLAFEIMDTPFMGLNSRAMKFVKIVDSPFLQIYPDLGNIFQWAKKKIYITNLI
ncbi:L-ribulose-5-phosphate 3-epimerase ulaE [Mycoplasmopsis californica]|nr:L-ribulose-5-phosphate 3-epimerase ulaE [Mycoplasmopsis californica]